MISGKNQTQHGCASSAFVSTALGTYFSSTTALPTPTPTDNEATTTTTSTADILTKLPEPSGHSGSPNNIGAIVGGAVGGFAALSVTGFGICFVRRRSKKDKNNEISGAMTESQPDEKSGGDVVVRHIQQSSAELSPAPPPQELDGVPVSHKTHVSPIGASKISIERRDSL